jgi:regulatory protein YycH of two-component signal transduction system YycFG
MQEDQRKDLLEKWQILGLSFMMMSETQEDFYHLVKQEFGYIWDGNGWIKEVSYHNWYFCQKNWLTYHTVIHRFPHLFPI